MAKILEVYDKKFKFDLFSSLLRDPNSSYDAFFLPKPISAEVVRKQRAVFLERSDEEAFLAFMRAQYDLRTAIPMVYPHKTISTPIGVLACFSSRSSSSSRVLYRSAHDGLLRAGQICSIFSHIELITTHPSSRDKVRIFAKVNTYQRLSIQDSELDPERNFPGCGFRLHPSSFDSQPAFVELENVLTRLADAPSATLVQGCILTVDVTAVGELSTS